MRWRRFRLPLPGILVALMVLVTLPLGSEIVAIHRSPVPVDDIVVTLRRPLDGDWLQFNNAFPTINTIRGRAGVTKQTVASLAPAWRTSIGEAADGSPIFVSGVRTVRGLRDLVIVTTNSGRTFALDGERGTVVWRTPGAAGPRWTTSSPLADPNRDYLYVYELDGAIHRYVLANGFEQRGDGWPQVVTLKGDVEKGSSALSMATARDGHTYLYMTTAGYPDPGDEGDYQGHLVAIDLDRGTQKIFNAACSDRAFHFVENGDASSDCNNVQAGIWARAGAVYDPVTDRLFVTTGNGVYDADRGGFNWGTSIVALRPDGSTDGGTPLDSWTPANYQQLTDDDLDLSSTTVAILPQPFNSTMPRLAVQGGKDAKLRLVDLANLSGQGGPRHVGGELETVDMPLGGGLFTRPATWLAPDGTPWVFIVNHHGSAGLALTTTADGKPHLEVRWKRSDRKGATPIIANGILYFAWSHQMSALDPTTGTLLWEDTGIGGIHWQSPIVVNQKLFVTDGDGFLNAYALPDE